MAALSHNKSNGQSNVSTHRGNHGNGGGVVTQRSTKGAGNQIMKKKNLNLINFGPGISIYWKKKSKNPNNSNDPNDERIYVGAI